ncbi:MAG: O-antigen ligase family protein [Verrucomicrobiota bacterium]
MFSAFYSIYYFLTYFILILNIYVTSKSNDEYASQFSSFINGLGLLIAVNFILYLVGIYNINEVINNQNYGSAKVLSLLGYQSSRVVFYFSSGFSSYGLLCVVYIFSSILRRKSSKSKISYVICTYALCALAFLSLLLVDSRNAFITLLIAFLTYNSYVSKLIFVGLTPVAAYLLVYLDQSIVLLNSYLIKTSRSESLLSGREEIWTNSIEYIFQNYKMFIIGNGLYGQATSGLSVACYVNLFADWNTSRPEWASLHNNFLQLVTDIGIVGAIIFYFLLMTFVVKNKLKKLSCSLLLILCVGGYVDVTIGLYNYLLFILFFFIVLNYNKHEKSGTSTKTVELSF